MAAKRRRQLHKRTSLAQSSASSSGRPSAPIRSAHMSCHVAGNFGRRHHYLESGAENAINSCLWAHCTAAVPSAHPLMMADPFSLIELLNKKGMLRGMAISSRRAMHRVRMRRNRMRQHFDTKHCAGRHSKFPIKKASLQAAFEVERWTKRWTCFAKQRPGRARQKLLAT